YEDNENYVMSVYIYGSPLPDGVTYEIEGITEEVIQPPETQIIEVSTWPEGYEEVFVTAREGYRASAYRYKLIDGETVETELLYTDVYNPVRGQVKVGTGDPRLPRPSGD
ncbi:MAG: G5 domain-containing protein, partial [Clostridia bacterium]|nr:G5 domain-containing protein [Clostridia bacterium]